MDIKSFRFSIGTETFLQIKQKSKSKTMTELKSDKKVVISLPKLKKANKTEILKMLYFGNEQKFRNEIKKELNLSIPDNSEFADFCTLVEKEQIKFNFHKFMKNYKLNRKDIAQMKSKVVINKHN